MHGPPLPCQRCRHFAVVAAAVVGSLLQGFLASDRKSALELFDKAEEFFKQCKENVSSSIHSRSLHALDNNQQQQPRGSSSSSSLQSPAPSSYTAS
jgi:hypothetical protein